MEQLENPDSTHSSKVNVKDVTVSSYYTQDSVKLRKKKREVQPASTKNIKTTSQPPNKEKKKRVSSTPLPSHNSDDKNNTSSTLQNKNKKHICNTTFRDSDSTAVNITHTDAKTQESYSVVSTNSSFSKFPKTNEPTNCSEETDRKKDFLQFAYSINPKESNSCNYIPPVLSSSKKTIRRNDPNGPCLSSYCKYKHLEEKMKRSNSTATYTDSKIWCTFNEKQNSKFDGTDCCKIFELSCEAKALEPSTYNENQLTYPQIHDDCACNVTRSIKTDDSPKMDDIQKEVCEKKIQCLCLKNNAASNVNFSRFKNLPQSSQTIINATNDVHRLQCIQECSGETTNEGECQFTNSTFDFEKSINCTLYTEPDPPTDNFLLALLLPVAILLFIILIIILIVCELLVY